MFHEQRSAGEVLDEMVEQAAEIIQRLPADTPAVTP
jgi:hypothetical protein